MSAQSMDAVGSNEDQLVLVNASDEVVGYGDKKSCHDNDGILHRAFSVFLFDTQGRLLLQRRSPKKRLWGHYWSNSCCSHPRPTETILNASSRRVREELGCSAPMTFLYKFEYRAEFLGLGVEHELCYVLAGPMLGEPDPDPDEVSDWQMVDPNHLDQEIHAKPEKFTPWLMLQWPQIRTRYWGHVTHIRCAK